MQLNCICILEFIALSPYFFLMKVKISPLYDIVALTSSFLCAIHCALVPIVLSFSSLGSLSFLTNPWIEWLFISLGLVLVAVSLCPSYKKIHLNAFPLKLAVVGFTFIGLSRLEINELWEPIFTVTGATIVASSHYKNWKLSKSAHLHQNTKE